MSKLVSVIHHEFPMNAIKNAAHSAIGENTIECIHAVNFNATVYTGDEHFTARLSYLNTILWTKWFK